jgi:hypothetical protein
MYAREPAELARQEDDHAVGFDILHPAERVEKRPQHERVLEDPKEDEERLDEAPVIIEGVHYEQLVKLARRRCRAPRSIRIRSTAAIVACRKAPCRLNHRKQFGLLAYTPPRMIALFEPMLSTTGYGTKEASLTVERKEVYIG